MDESPRLKCKLRIGTSEIELEGTGRIDDRVSDRILELIDMFEDALSSPIQELAQTDTEAAPLSKDDTEGTGKDKKKDARGGKRQPFISRNIKELGTKGKIANVTAADVNGMLKELYGLHVEEGSVYAALKRGLGKTLTRTGTTPQDSRFTYIAKKEGPKAEEPQQSGT